MERKLPLTLDEFFDYTQYPLLSISPTGEHLLIRMKRPLWDSNKFQNSLWLYKTKTQQRKLITQELSQTIKPQWSPNGKWVVLSINTNHRIKRERHRRQVSENYMEDKQYIYLYSIESDKLLSISIGQIIPSAIGWSENDGALYFATFANLFTKEEAILYETEWKDVVQPRTARSKQGSTIYRINIFMNNGVLSTRIYAIRNVPFLVTELLLSPIEQKLILNSASETLENLNNFELYSIDLRNTSSLVRLTYNEGIEQDLQLSNDGKRILFQLFPLSSPNGKFNNTQQRLYSADIRTGQIDRFAKDFDGSIVGYGITKDGNVYILGQLGVDIHIYSQRSPKDHLIAHRGWTGAYESIGVSSLVNQNCSIAFIYSSLRTPKEVYCINNINQLETAKAITNENGLVNQRIIPESKIYKWRSSDDNRMIEGILHYPPGKLQAKYLPLLVLIHGGPYDASLNHWQGNGYFWAPLAALDGWLVLEPNYRGSMGYGDSFLSELVHKPLNRPLSDILSGVDHLINDGTVDSRRLAIGGYSYGGVLTNWIITQTKRFNAALSGAGTVEPVSIWGTTDLPVALSYTMGGFPWQVPHIYQNSSAIYFLSRVRTPTHIVTGALDIRVPPEQSYMLERGLHSLGIPVQLLVFPDEGHSVINSRKPSYGKIKVREELKWLKKYGHQSWKQ